MSLYTPGASKQLGTIIEGESLLNDGATIVLFNVLLYELIPGQSQTGTPETAALHYTYVLVIILLSSLHPHHCRIIVFLPFQHSRYLSTLFVLHWVVQFLAM